MAPDAVLHQDAAVEVLHQQTPVAHWLADGIAEVVRTFVLRVPAIEGAGNGVAGRFVPDAAIAIALVAVAPSGATPFQDDVRRSPPPPPRRPSLRKVSSRSSRAVFAEIHQRDRRRIGPDQLEAELEDALFEGLAIETIGRGEWLRDRIAIDGLAAVRAPVVEEVAAQRVAGFRHEDLERRLAEIGRQLDVGKLVHVVRGGDAAGRWAQTAPPTIESVRAKAASDSNRFIVNPSWSHWNRAPGLSTDVSSPRGNADCEELLFCKKASMRSGWPGYGLCGKPVRSLSADGVDLIAQGACGFGGGPGEIVCRGTHR